ncbi:MAG TPA: PAS domain S-box protein, partial [Gemmatimonadaceae bacterium]
MIKDATTLFMGASGGPASGSSRPRRSGQAGLTYDLLLRAQEMVHVGAWAASIDAVTSKVVGDVLLTDEMCRLLGMAPDSGPVTFERFVAAIHLDDRERVQRLIMNAIRHRIPFRFDFRVATDGNHLKMVNLRANFEDNGRGDIVRLLGTAADVTDRYRAEKALSQTETRLRAVFEQSAVGMAVAGINGRLLQVNQSFADMLGYRVSELEAKTFLEITYPGDLATTVEHTFRNNHGRSVTYEKRYVRRDGTPVWARVTVCRLSLGGDSDAFMAVIEDIDERRRNEAAMQQMQQRLAQTQTLEALGQLAGGVAHDFNNLLTVIAAGATFIEEEADGNRAIRSDAMDIQAACSRAASLTRELLAFSRRQLLHPEVLDVNDVVRSMGTSLARILGENIELEVDCAAASASIEVDRHQLEHVILNLAVNARDAITEHGTVTLATSNTAGADGRPGVLIEVRDDGVGIEAAVLHRVFEPFFTTKAIGKGAGLGLATVLGVVEQSGG